MACRTLGKAFPPWLTRGKSLWNVTQEASLVKRPVTCCALPEQSSGGSHAESDRGASFESKGGPNRHHHRP